MGEVFGVNSAKIDPLGRSGRVVVFFFSDLAALFIE